MAREGYTPYQFQSFAGGLNLRDKADVVSDAEAIDLLNVTFTKRGAIQQRDGYVDLTAALTNRVDSLGVFYTASGTRQLLAGCGTRLEALSTAGAVVASQTGLAGGPYVFARTAAPGSEFAYAANGTDTLQRWSGSAWSSGASSATVNGAGSAAMPKAGAVTVTAAAPGLSSSTNAANRLVATAYGTATTNGPGGTTSNPSRVHFSNPGLPETWETDGSSGRGRNFIDLTPGDGEQILNAVRWRELVFVFKQTKFFVIYGESTDAAGLPVFNYREVNTGVGLAAKLAVAPARDGVYFMDRGGVYVTTGGEPKLISGKIGPIWTGDVEVYFQSEVLNAAQIALARMAWNEADELLYLALPTGVASANDRVLVFDTEHGWWSLFDIPASALVAFRRGDLPELHFGYSTGANKVGRLSTSADDDSAVAITSRWRSGWGDYGDPAVKTVRESKLWGSGAATVRYSKDFETTPTEVDTVIFAGSATWPTSGTWADWIALNNGVWPGVGQINSVLSRKAVRATAFSTEFANNAASSSWGIHRVAKHLREKRVESVEHT